MKKILVAIDDTKVSKTVLSTYAHLVQPGDRIILLHVKRLEGRSLMIDMLGDAELSTLKESLQGTEHEEALDRKAGKILDYYRRKLEKNGCDNVTTVLREGRPAEEILEVAEAEKVNMILLGNGGKKKIDRLISGSVAAEVRKDAQVPVVTAERRVLCEEPYSWGDAYAAFSALTIVMFGLLLLGFVMQ